MQLCAIHWSARDGLYKQAGREDKRIASTLSDVEIKNAGEFLQHVSSFCTEPLGYCLTCAFEA